MIRSRVLVFLSIALCFAVCLCADATEDEKTAEQNVRKLKELAANVLRKAEAKYSEAQSTKDTVKSQKDKAESAASAVAATAIAEKDNAEVKVIAQKAQSEMQDFHTLHTNAKDKAEEAFNQMSELLSKARDLNRQSNEILSTSVEPINYAQIIQNAATAQNDTETLNKEIDETAKVINTANVEVWKLKDGAKKVQVSKYQADSIVIYFQIESALKTAGNDMKSIEEKRDEISATVQVMNGKFQSAPDKLKNFLSSMCSSAESELQTATNKVKAANKCIEDMQERKTQVNEELAAVKIETEEDKAKKLFDAFVYQKRFFDAQIQSIKQALETAGNSVTSANHRHEQMDETISDNNRQSGSEANKLKTKDNVPTEEVTNPIRNAEENEPVITSAEKPTVVKTDEPEITDKDKKEKTDKDKQEITETAKPTGSKTDGPEITITEKPVITETEKPILGKSEDTMDKTSDQPVDANLDNTEEKKSTQLTHKGKQNPKDGNSELLNNDKLRKITKDITNNPLIGGELPTRSAANDSAVTVFIPLLVILVMSAVLH